ncbi:MAG: NAD(P) transhydrogenase subunit alpha [Gammaproteobacteria bacterium]|nr:NAD(P) transhydrogenase subunit alpha [Gammaproteobacteria bacterium]MCW9055461.1 NAD(P) transhydrogenase subunit alpha [Gammaproteobacteria bacterium]
MPIRLAVPNEIVPGERRIALEPGVAKRLLDMGVDVCMERGAALSAHFPDDAFEGVTIIDTAEELYKDADLIFKVQPPTLEELDLIKDGAIVVGFMQPHTNKAVTEKMCEKQLVGFAMELVPRISRAQSMDALSSQAAISGYKGVLMGADLASVFFPMLTTAAGTIRPAKVLVIGAGVAGLQAIATAKRLGAVVEAYDVRSATREQCESLGAKFVDTGVSADGEGGYARELTEEEKQQQQDVLAEHIAQSDVVITTAAIPGKPSPRIISKEMVARMKVGAVIVDLAAEGGGNCELSEPGHTVDFESRVTIHAPLNVPSQTPVHASEMYAKNLFNFISPFITESGDIELDWNDEILAKSVLLCEGVVRSNRVRRDEEITR